MAAHQNGALARPLGRAHQRRLQILEPSLTVGLMHRWPGRKPIHEITRNGTDKLLPLRVNSWIAFLFLSAVSLLEPFSAASHGNPTRGTKSTAHSPFRRRCRSMRAPKAHRTLPQPLVPWPATCPE